MLSSLEKTSGDHKSVGAKNPIWSVFGLIWAAPGSFLPPRLGMDVTSALPDGGADDR